MTDNTYVISDELACKLQCFCKDYLDEAFYEESTIGGHLVHSDVLTAMDTIALFDTNTALEYLRKYRAVLGANPPTEVALPSEIQSYSRKCKEASDLAERIRAKQDIITRGK